MAAGRTNLELYSRLNGELVAMIDQFANLVKATKEGLEADEAPSRAEAAAAGGGSGGTGGAAAGGARERRVPGELLEVSVEKLLAAGNQCVHTVSELKKGAILSDMDALLANVNSLNADLAGGSHSIEGALAGIRREAESLLGRLEAQYYSSSSRGQPTTRPAHPATASLAELCGQALQMVDDMHLAR